MPTHGLMRVLAARLDEMAQSGRLKGRESVICGVVPGRDVYPRAILLRVRETPLWRRLKRLPPAPLLTGTPNRRGSMFGAESDYRVGCIGFERGKIQAGAYILC